MLFCARIIEDSRVRLVEGTQVITIRIGELTIFEKERNLKPASGDVLAETRAMGSAAKYELPFKVWIT